MEALLDLLYSAYVLQAWYYLSSFIIIISVIVFIHEFGHYGVAKLCGVKIEAFAIGFGPEIVGINDRSGTRWKLCAVPMGGYVKMYGDTDPASSPDTKQLSAMSEADKKQAFHFKPLPQKAAIVAAGPIANFILAIVILTSFLFIYGQRTIEPTVGSVLEKSAAAEAGLQAGDRIIAVDGNTIEDFSDITSIVSLNTGTAIQLSYDRQGKQKDITLTPRIMESKDLFGNPIRRAIIGITPPAATYKKIELSLLSAVGVAAKQTYDISMNNLRAMGQIVTGDRSVKDLGGPVKIARYSGQAAELGLQMALWLMAVLSISLGLINLFPVPVLDGGHLLYYIIEALRGEPVAMKFQEYTMKAGMAFILLLAVVVTFNDIMQLVKE